MRTAFILSLVVLTSTGGEICVAHAIKLVGEVRQFSPISIFRFVSRCARQVWLWIGVVLLAVSFYAFLVMLSWYPVSFVVPATSLAYVVGPFAARFLLRERLNAMRWAGVVLICVGVALAWMNRFPALPNFALLRPWLRDLVFMAAVVPLLFYFSSAWAAIRFFAGKKIRKRIPATPSRCE